MGFPIEKVESINIERSGTTAVFAESLESRESTDRAIQGEFAFDVAETPRPILRVVSQIPERPDAEVEADVGSSRILTDKRSQKMGRWIAVVGGCGYVPVAPGTAGSAAGALLFMGLFELTPDTWTPIAFHLTLACLILGLTLLGIWASGVAERGFGTKDDGRIVIDEVVGQLIALFPLSFLLNAGTLGPAPSFFSVFVGVVTGFVLFRLFDVWKPGAIGWAERNFKGGFGVMADDLVAGGYAAAMLVVVAIAAELASPGIFSRMTQDGMLSSLSGGLSTLGRGIS